MANDAVLLEAASLQPTALLSFFILDVTSLGGGVLYLTPYIAGTVQEIMWQGQNYTGFPIEFTGQDFKGTGALSQPTIRFGNVLGTFSSLCLQYDNLCGAKLTRKRTFAKFLDGQPGADPTAAWADDVYEVNRKSYEDRNSVEFELASAMDVDGVQLPRRQVMSAQCAWIYRSAECSFAGTKCIATKLDVPISGVGQNYRGQWASGTAYAARDVIYRQIGRAKRFFMARATAPLLPFSGVEPPDDQYWLEDACSLTLTGCGLRFPGVKPFGGFPGTQRVNGT